MSEPTLTINDVTFPGEPGPSTWLRGWPDMDTSNEYRGEGRQVPYRPGVIYQRRWPDMAVFEFPVAVFGDELFDGTPQADVHDGLTENLRSLRAMLSAQHHERMIAQWTHADETFVAEVHATLGGSRSGPGTFDGWVSLEVPDGKWRAVAETEVTSPLSAATRTITVPNNGSQLETGVRILLDGDSGVTSVELRNLTWDPDGSLWWRFGGEVVDGIAVDCARWTAIRDGTDSVVGLVSHSGHERWLPLVTGDNDIEIEPSGGEAEVTLTYNEIW